MKHNFEYFYSMRPNDSIDIEDISKVCLNALNDVGQEWYIKVNTVLGDTTIERFGPIMVDLNGLINSFTYNYITFPYNEGKIIKNIDTLINNEKYCITQVLEIDEDTFNDRLRGIMDERYK